jgi:2-polyprenyl-3-methyl-5-hydroxy-6-metoxy-1,4-benzoquinol methylase
MKKKKENINLRNSYIGDFNKINFDQKYDAIWYCHILEHQLNPNLFLTKLILSLKKMDI